ncbi:MAG: NAD(+)/NADH kinase [Eubacteriales bacterium]|nr:NAD(+)/NADH kinase [Eubacteriales bacterium]
MKNFYIIISEYTTRVRSITNVRKRLEEGLRARGARVDVHEGYLDRNFMIPEDVDCVITVGGDGTVLRASRAAFGRKVVFLGINRGHMGYLTELTDIANYDEIMDRLINNDFKVEERMMLSAAVYRNGKRIFRDYALNDVLLGKNDCVHMMTFELYINDTFINSYRADGVVVSSPTGSTCYSMSAGGPIAEPTAKLLLVSPICPHAVNTRPLVLSPDDKVKLIPKHTTQLVSCDGADGTELLADDELVVAKSVHSMKFIRFKETSFLDTLRERMRYV